jgi:Integrase core domain
VGHRHHLHPAQQRFVYLVAIVDLFSRNVPSWRLSNNLDTEFCLEALEMALEFRRKPEVFHSDQGCQFTSSDFVTRLQAEEIKMSWSGRKRCYDIILVERLWMTNKYEEVYLRAYSDGWEAEISLARFLWRYCHVRPHSSLGGNPPMRSTLRPNPVCLSGVNDVRGRNCPVKGTHLMPPCCRHQRIPCLNRRNRCLEPVAGRDSLIPRISSSSSTMVAQVLDSRLAIKSTLAGVSQRSTWVM